ncbi:MAG: lysine--tRNA ligase, partial [Sulfurospirillaceae bacterium]|nr:lysine--tRNA ligase [Sulfurospirillaceae bacterium]
MIFQDQYQQQRIEKGNALRALGKNPYRHNITKDTSTKEFLECYEYVIKSETVRDEQKSNTVVGRIKFLRHMGKAAFAKVEDEHGMLQIYFSRES